jgi:hypothetical protein
VAFILRYFVAFAEAFDESDHGIPPYLISQSSAGSLSNISPLSNPSIAPHAINTQKAREARNAMEAIKNRMYAPMRLIKGSPFVRVKYLLMP